MTSQAEVTDNTVAHEPGPSTSSSNQRDLEAGRLDGQSTQSTSNSESSIENLPILDRLLCGALFVTAVLQVSFDNPKVQDQLSVACWIALTFYILWVFVAFILLCRHITVFRRHAKAVILSTAGICILVIHFLDLTPSQVVIYVPLIIDISLAMPFTGSLVESLLS